jgi:hypothetical protein
MNHARKIQAGIDTVKLTLRSIILDWDASDIPRMGASVAKLEASVQPLRTALDNPEIVGHLSTIEFKTAAHALRREAATLERLVDAAAAFVRSASAFSSDGGNAYTFSGEIGPAGAPPAESYAG